MKRLAVVMAALLLAGCGGGPSYDEAAHRADVEESIGHPVADWPTYLDAVRDTCEAKKDAFALSVALHADDGTLQSMRVNVRHLCPHRSQEIDETLTRLKG